MADTELKLKIWRGDQIRAERLAAAILHIEGFSSVDPQCPLGGPDGLKDVLCEKSTWKYVAAAYFPTTDQSFKKIQDKFEHDLPGVARNSADGLVFLTNQSRIPKVVLNKPLPPSGAAEAEPGSRRTSNADAI